MAHPTTATTTRTIHLARDQMLRLERAYGRIEISHGWAWLTEEGALADTFLAAGEQWPLTGRPVILSALSSARLRIDAAAGRGRFAPGRFWRPLVRALRRHRQRLQFGPAEQASWG